MRHWIRSLAGVGVVLGALTAAGPARAQDAKAGGEDAPVAKSSPQSKGAEDVGAAFRMAAIGRETKSPEALIAAARVIGTTKFVKPDMKDAKVAKPEEFDPKKEALALLDDAAKMDVPGAEGLKPLIDAARKTIEEGPKGAIGGPQTRMGSVGPGDPQDTWPIAFRGGEMAVVIVNNLTNRGDIDLVVVDDNGRVVRRDRRLDDDAYVTFFVPRTATYYLKVQKYGNVGGVLRYRLTTN